MPPLRWNRGQNISDRSQSEHGSRNHRESPAQKFDCRRMRIAQLLSKQGKERRSPTPRIHSSSSFVLFFDTRWICLTSLFFLITWAEEDLLSGTIRDLAVLSDATIFRGASFDKTNPFIKSVFCLKFSLNRGQARSLFCTARAQGDR